MVRRVLLKEQNPSCDLKNKGLNIFGFGEGEFLAIGVARAKALRQERAGPPLGTERTLAFSV